MKFDTVTKSATRIYAPYVFVNDGTTDGYQIDVPNNSKPFTATLNLLPPSKGIFYLPGYSTTRNYQG